MAFADAQSSGVILYGSGAAKVKLAAAAVVGDALGYSGGWKLALATVGTCIQQRAVAGEAGEIGQEITVYIGKVIVNGRFSGATADGSLYVAEGTDSGQYTQTAPTTTGDADKKVGIMIDAVTAVIFPNRDADSVA